MTMRDLLIRVARLLGDASGAAAVELALVAPFIVGIIVPMADLGIGAYDKMQVQDAAEAGVQYVLVNGYNETDIENAAQSATSLGTNVAVSVTPSNTCYCVSSGTLSSAGCGSSCSDGSTAANYVGVTASYTYTPLFTYAGLGSSVSISSTATSRY
jgi:Flp pilus assembly protein TadG